MEVDIITYSPADVVKDFHFPRRQYRQATDRGIFFEIPYSCLLRDSNMRKKIIQMAHLYHAVGKSKVLLFDIFYL